MMKSARRTPRFPTRLPTRLAESPALAQHAGTNVQRQSAQSTLPAADCTIPASRHAALRDDVRAIDVHDTTQCYAHAGTMVVCVSGSVAIVEAPFLIAERLFQHRLTLQEGEMYVLRVSGWVDFTAVGETRPRVARLAIQTARNPVLELGRTLIRWLV